MVIELFALNLILGSITTSNTVTNIILSPQLHSPIVEEIQQSPLPTIVPSPEVLTAAIKITTTPSPLLPTTTPTVTTSPTIQPTASAATMPTQVPAIKQIETSMVISQVTPSPTPQPSSTATPNPTSANTPTPTVLQAKVTSAELESYFTKYSDQYKVDKELLKRIAKCESGFNTNAKNLSYVGLYQFSENTWSAQRKRMGLPTDISLRSNAEESIKTASYMIANGGQNAWPNCK